jgi:hypothetical protein
MNILETVEAIKNLPHDGDLGARDNFAGAGFYEVDVSPADLRALVEEYEKLRDAAWKAFKEADNALLDDLRESYSRPLESPPARSGDGLGGTESATSWTL